jgi:hypothetical protein
MREYTKILFITKNNSVIELNDLPREDLLYFLEFFNQLRIRQIQEMAKQN